MAIVTLIRHTTPAIEKGICYGRLDVDVAASFVDEASHVIAQLHQLPKVTRIYSSPAKRAMTLASYISRCDDERSKVITDSRLQELDFGHWEGRTWNDIARVDIDAWASDVIGYQMPGGESGEQLARRVEAFYLQNLCAVEEGSHKVVVAHAGSIKALLAHAASTTLAKTVAWDMPFGAVISWRLG